MRRLTIGSVLLSILAVMAIMATDADARRVTISGTHSRGEIKKACAAVDGICGGCNATSGKYSCDNLNKGTSVTCDPQGHCTGYVPRDKIDTITLNNALGIKTQ